MADLSSAARMLRWAAGSIIFQMERLPADRLGWKPEPEAKSALEIAGEAVAALRMMQPVFDGGAWERIEFPRPATLEEARPLLAVAAEEYAAALEAAGEALERPLRMPYGTLWASRAVLF